MKTLIYLYVVVLASVTAYAQQPSPDPDTLKNPIKQIDPVPAQEPAEIQYVDESVRIAADELPQAVLDSLKALEPAAWEKSVVYREKNGEGYRIEVRDGGQERNYRFNKEGVRVKTLDEEESDNNGKEDDQRR